MKKWIIALTTSFFIFSTLILSSIAAVVLLVNNSNSSNVGVVNSDSLKNLNAEQKQFIDKILNGSVKGYQQYKVFPSVTIAQAIIESGWGKSKLTLLGNNLFGIKASSAWKGRTINMPTLEEFNGQKVTVNAVWRCYDSLDDSVEDHGKFLAENSIYSQAGVFDAKNYREQVIAIKNAGYATDSSYVDLICNTIECYGLNALDGTNTSLPVGGGSTTIENAIGTGRSLIGNSTYIYGRGRTEEDIQNRIFDCSSFIHYIFECSGVQLGDRGATTYTLINLGTPVDKASLQRGDLIFFNTVGVNSHVGIYLGNNQFMHCSTSKGVVVSDFPGYYENVFYQARRVVQ